jgi:hypothetical protein
MDSESDAVVHTIGGGAKTVDGGRRGGTHDQWRIQGCVDSDSGLASAVMAVPHNRVMVREAVALGGFVARHG